MNLRFYGCHRTSFFTFAEYLLPDAPMRPPFHRICCLMRKSRAISFLIDKNIEESPTFSRRYPAVKDEILHLQSQYPGLDITVTQVTFFSVRIPETSSHLPKRVTKAHLLATCVLLNLDWSKVNKRPGSQYPRAFMYEGVVGFPSAIFEGTRQNLLNNYYHISTDTTVCVAGRSFTINASYFCQQNKLTSVCAHSSLKMALWYLGNGRYQPSTRKMNDIVLRHRTKKGIPARRKNLPISDGLYLDDIQAICSAYKASTFIHDCKAHPEIPAYEFAYLLVESGIPTIVAFAPNSRSRVCHMMPVLGHTMNSDEWFPFAINFFKDLPLNGLRAPNDRYLSSSEWAAHLVVHDDMLGPYMCLDADALMREKVSKSMPVGRIRYVIGITSKHRRLHVSPYLIQQAAVRFFWGDWPNQNPHVCDTWRKRLQSLLVKEEDNARRLVVRTILVRQEDYLRELRAGEDHLGKKAGISAVDLRRLCRRLPQRFWMTELSLPELHSTNRAKFGEILLPLSLSEGESILRPKYESPPPLAFRTLNHLDIYDGSPIRLGFISHLSLFRRNPIQNEF